MATMNALRTGWVGNGSTATPYRPAVVGEYSLITWQDTGGMDIPDGSTEITLTTDQATVDLITADTDYGTTVARTWFASPSGSASGDGSYSRPWTLTAALAKTTIIKAGDTLALRGGSYDIGITPTIVSLEGSSGKRITIRPHTGEWAKISGTFDTRGQYVDWVGLEIYSAHFTDRETLDSGVPAEITNQGWEAFIVNSNNIGIYNCVIHDKHQGIRALQGNQSNIIHGNVIFNCGWSGPDRGHGHGIYVNNTIGVLEVSNNVIGPEFGYGIHCYGEDNAHLDNVLIEGNISFRAGILYGLAQGNILHGGISNCTAVSPIWRNNSTYHPAGETFTNRLGWSAGATNATIENNYMPEGLTKVNVTVASETGNIYTEPGSGTVAFLGTNDYDANKSILAIFNWDLSDTVVVVITGTYANNDVLNVHNAADYFNDIQELVVVNNSITVNMQAVNRSIATPQGWSAPTTTFPQFGAFVIQKA